MEEVKKEQPAASQDIAPVKSADEVLQELRAENDRLNKQIKDKDEFIGRQSGEIGDLRKRAITPEPEVSLQDTDPEVKEIVDGLKQKGLDDQAAKFNAEILLDFDRKRMGKRVMQDTIDLVDEALDEGRIDKKLFTENQQDIIQEFKSRKLAPTARQNFKIMKSCVDYVIRKKADALRDQNRDVNEGKREQLIGEGQVPSGGKRELPQGDEAKTQADAIRNAGVSRNNVFF